jgi:hypothetical protein
MRTGASTDAIPREATDGRAARATTGRSWAGKARAERSAPSDGAPAAHAGMSRPRGARNGHRDGSGERGSGRARTAAVRGGRDGYAWAVVRPERRRRAGRCRRTLPWTRARRTAVRDPRLIRQCAPVLRARLAPRAWKPSWKRTTAGLRSSRTAFSRRTRRSWVDIRDRGTGCNAARHRWCALQAGGRRFGTGWLHCLEVPAIGVF